MLILSEPIQLNSLSHIVSANEGFCERMRSNYEQMNVQINAEDLLHIAVTDPEIIVGGEGVTNLMSENNIYNNDSFKLEVINNVVNRIALSQSAELTYQDRTYITSVLNKLGITDVQQFMNDVRNLAAHTNNINELIFSYYQAGDILKLIRENSTVIREKDEQRREEAPEAKQEVYLHNEIYKHLHTKNIYGTMQSYYRNYESQYSNVTANEMRFADYMRLSNTLLLSEMKENVYNNESVTLQHHFNSYEYGNLEELQREQPGKVIESRMAAAVLMNLVDSVYTTRLNEITNNSDIWMHIEKAMNDTAENTIERFNFYHTEQKSYLDNSHRYMQRINNEMHNEFNAISDITESYEQKLQFLTENREFDSEEIQSFVNEVLANETDILENVIEQSTYAPVLANIIEEVKKKSITSFADNRQTRTDNNVTTINRNEYSSDVSRNTDVTVNKASMVNIVNEEEENVDNINKISEEVVKRTENYIGNKVNEYHSEQANSYTSVTNEYRDGERTGADREKGAIVRENSNKVDSPEMSAADIVNIQNEVNVDEENIRINNEQAGSVTQVTKVYHEKEQYAVLGRPVEEKAEVVTPESLGESAADIVNVRNEENVYEGDELKTYLDEINRQNIEKYHTAQHKQTTKVVREAANNIQADISRTRKATLEAVRDQKAVNKMIAAMKSKEESKEEKFAMALETLDPETKSIYEKIISYQNRGPQSEASEEFIPTTTAQFMSDLRTIERINNETVKEHVTVEHEEVTKEVEKQVAHQIGTASAGKVLAGEVDENYKSISFVHKTTENEIDEEQLAQMIKNSTNTVTTVEDNRVVTNDNVTRTEINNLSNEIVERTTKQVSTQITKNLDKEIASISDQVYNKLEKRLKSERARRGF